MRPAALASTICLILASSAPALAQEKNEDWDGGFNVDFTRRSDFTLGVSSGFFGGTAKGFPNEAGKLDNPAFESTASGAGFGGGLWLGGALRDWFVFGVGFVSDSFKSGDDQVNAFAFVFRIETFPAFPLGGQFENIGVFTQLGAGGAKTERSGETRADGGSMSLVTLGTFWEALRFWRFNLGPNLEYTHMFSESMTLHAGSLGLRLALYTGPGEKKSSRQSAALPR